MASGQLLARKPVDHVRAEFAQSQLKRTLGPFNLVTLGIGCIIGAGIFVITGSAAANFAGPAVLFSFVVAGIACAFAGLCYAELASTMPVPGSAYTYAYVTLGEVFAWTMGWLLLLEYGVAASTVAAGWTGYVLSLIANFGIHVPAALSQSALQYQGGVLNFTPSVNLVGAIGIGIVTTLLVIGVRESAQVNNVIVVIKVSVLVAFVIVGVAYIDPANWKPFIPANEGGFHYGWLGIFRAASLIFFAYIGFEAVSTAAGEARNPQRDLPIGILGSLVVCTIIYMAVAAVLTGVVPFHRLGVPDPIAIAVDRMNPSWAIVPWPLSGTGTLNVFSFIIKIGAFTGLTSVMLVLCYGQTRVFYQMARDGLIPEIFSRVNPRFRTPAAGTILLGSVIALGAATLPLTVLNDLVSLGTALAFSIVCISVIYLRRNEPNLPRPFRVPFYPLTPILGAFFCVVFMVGPILLDIVSKGIGKDLLGSLFGSPDTKFQHDPIALEILLAYIVAGALIYLLFGYRNSRLGQGRPAIGIEPAPMELPH
ncbi:MAG TPA: amino acid permease [Rhizomicrobium sp.]|jgi:APA family basic amino acid/polyamine antiporter